MNANYEKIQRTPSGNIKFRTIAILAFIAFICGSIAAGWAITKYDLFQPVGSGPGSQNDQNIAANPNGTAANEVAIGNNSANPQPLLSANRQNNGISGDLAGQKQIGNQAGPNQAGPNQSINNQLPLPHAQGQQRNINRTESILVAFAARRAIDRGAPLGYIEEELRRKFAQTNANDVAAIIMAGEKPVRLSVLQNQLDTATEILMTADSDASAWDKIKKEMRELFVIRKAGIEELQPNRQLARIKSALADRDVQTAIIEMKQMPGASKAQKWIDLANRYVRVQNALDAIEKTAIAMPVNLRSSNNSSLGAPTNPPANFGTNQFGDNFNRNNQPPNPFNGQNPQLYNRETYNREADSRAPQNTNPQNPNFRNGQN